MIEVVYYTLPGLSDKLNAIDTEDTGEQFTSILSLVILPAVGDADPTAVLITKTEFVPDEVKAALAAEATDPEDGDEAASEASPGTETGPPEFFAAPEAAEADESV